MGVLGDSRSYEQGFDVGSDDVLSYNQMIDIGAWVLGRPHPHKIHLPVVLLGLLAPLIERVAKLPQGAFKSLLDSTKTDGIGDPLPVRTLLPRPLLSYRQAVERVLTRQKS